MRLRSYAVVVILSLVSAACASSQAPSNKNETIGILVNGPLTGYSGDLGTSICNGAKLAAQDLNAAGGVKSGPHQGAKYAIQCADNPDFSADVAATIASRYLSDKSIWVSMGYGSSAEAVAAASVVQSAHLTVIGSDVGAVFLTTRVHNILAIFPVLSAAGYALTDFCQAYYKGKTIGQILATYSFFGTYLIGEQQALQSDQMKVVADLRYDPGSVANFAPFLQKVKAANPDCVFPGDYAPVEQQIVVQGRQLGMKQPFLDFAAAGTTPDAVKTLGTLGKGFIFVDFAPFDRGPATYWGKVAAEYQRLYNAPMNYYPGYSYDSVLAVEYALENGAKTREDLLDYLPKVNGAGIVGQIQFSSNKRILERPMELLEQTGPSISDLETVGEYLMEPDGSARLVTVANCASRPTCQLNLASSSP